MLIRRAALAAIVVAIGVVGFVVAAPDHGTPAAAATAAPTLDTRVAVSGNIPTARPEDFRRPIAVYRRHVRAALAAMLGDTRRLDRAIASGDLSSARRAWLSADARYESIGAAYGAFGDLDAAINGRPGGLAGGERSPAFTGLHRVELILWGDGTTRGATPFATKLTRDVGRLRRHVATATIDPLDYALRAHEVLEDSLQLQLAGVANRWSRSQLVALRANVRGTTVVYDSLRAMVRRRNAAVARRAERALDRLRAAVTSLQGTGGTLPTWNALSQRERERVNGLTANAAEQLAYVPDLIDPRPPLPPKSALAPERDR